ncbi:Na+/H+ antiporter subunit A [Varibaculum vaginae]|uniref:Na+/H+ antiporter subunit A n=1 Tax=Varibaculum vaginae TaxID=2364797 RepID=UPI000F08160A|nr:Na+/H+ antiporter subunit A [Varibaculum vaginae]
MLLWDCAAPLIVCYLLAALLIPFLVKHLRQRTFYFAALMPFIALFWTLSHTRQAFATGSQGLADFYQWSTVLNLEIGFRLTGLSWLMLIVINLVGTLILLYCAQYFSENSPRLGQFIAAFLGFAASMSGLVLADHTMTLYFFWEITTFTSFILIGHEAEERASRAAARQAILVTTTGSLSMFAGFVILGIMPGGSFRISELLTVLSSPNDLGTPLDPVTAASGLSLILFAAVTKSAIFPTHFWLPAAMAAPTPVSAFLHAAAMVKAGIYLLARFAPAFARFPGLTWTIVSLGAMTMLLGGYSALRQTDLKLVLAFGTVSQLGLLTMLIGSGSPQLYLAGLCVLSAHSTFKSGLFLTTGTIEKQTGTREFPSLCGLGERSRKLAICALAGILSMSGIPITSGYLGKEHAITSLLNTRIQLESGAILAVLTVGSALTFAYSLRYFWGAFSHKHDRQGTCPHRQKLRATGKTLTIVPGLLTGLSLLLGFLPATLDNFLGQTALQAYGKTPGHLHLWSGIIPGLVTIFILVTGGWLFWIRARLARLQRRLAFSPRWGAQGLYSRTIRSLESSASWLTGKVQTGSLPADLSVIFTVSICAGTICLLGISDMHRWHFADSFGQAFICLALIGMAATCVAAQRRLNAVLALSACGAAVAAVYVLQGAPDLALTQLVVEAITLTLFLLVLRRLPPRFSRRLSRWAPGYRLLMAAACGVGIVLLGLSTSSARVHEPVSNLVTTEGSIFAGGQNLVNILLVDVRAWDTVGELSVLLVAATGVTALIYLRGLSTTLADSQRARRHRLLARARKRREHLKENSAAPQQTWLAVATLISPRRRSILLEVSTRILFHTLLLVSIWLLFIGHNHPGGGFIGGMVAGIAITIRYFAGGRFELLEAVPARPGGVIAIGMTTAVVSALVPLAFGYTILQSVEAHLDLGVLGGLHFTSAMGLDIGVYLLVIGVVLDLLQSLGSEIDRQGESVGHQLPETDITGREDPADHSPDVRDTQEGMVATPSANEEKNLAPVESSVSKPQEAQR